MWCQALDQDDTDTRSSSLFHGENSSLNEPCAAAAALKQSNFVSKNDRNGTENKKREWSWVCGSGTLPPLLETQLRNVLLFMHCKLMTLYAAFKRTSLPPYKALLVLLCKYGQFGTLCCLLHPKPFLPLVLCVSSLVDLERSSAKNIHRKFVLSRSDVFSQNLNSVILFLFLASSRWFCAFFRADVPPDLLNFEIY